MWRLLPALLVPVGAGLAVTHWAWRDADAGPWRHVLKASLAVGGGLALSSGAFFLASLAWGPSRRVAIAADVLVLLGALALVWLGRPASDARRDAAPSGAGPAAVRGTPTALRVALGVALVTAAAAFLLLSRVQPHGEWDAWAFWNLRARFWFAGGAHWRTAFDALAGPHPDYPLLLPGAVARLWLYVGRATVVAPVLVAMLFTFATVGVAAAAVATRRGGAQGALAALVLLGSAAFTVAGTMQYADVPLAFFILATLVLFWLSDRGSARGRVVGLAGAMAGFGAWTKNEGLLFLVAVLVARLAVAVTGGGWRRYARELVPFGAALAPVLAMVAYFKLRLAPPALFMLGERLEVVRERATDLARYARIGEALLGQLFGLGDWIVSAAGVLAAYALLVGVRVPPDDRRPLAASGLALAIVLAGYAAVFLLTVEALDNWLASGLTRLLLHLWPGAVFVYWLAVRPLSEAP